MSVFLLIALALGGVLLFARFKAHEKDFGGIGRYRDRGDNATAWLPYDRFTTPDARTFLRDFCRDGCPDSSFASKLLPDDELRHVLLSFRDPEGASPGNPVELYAKVLYQESGHPYPERLTDTTTMAGLLAVVNELEGPARRERARRDSADSARDARAKWAGDYREGSVRDSLDSIARQASERAAEQRRRDSLSRVWSPQASQDGSVE